MPVGAGQSVFDTHNTENALQVESVEREVIDLLMHWCRSLYAFFVTGPGESQVATPTDRQNLHGLPNRTDLTHQIHGFTTLRGTFRQAQRLAEIRRHGPCVISVTHRSG